MRIRRTAPRRGMTIVESALVLAVFAMFLFGLFEYSRFLMVLHVTNNAARDGARYAVVNLNKPSDFDTTDFTDAGGVTFPSIQNYTRSRMGTVDRQLSNFAIGVYAVDPAGLAQNPPVIRPKTADTTAPITYPDPFNAADPNHVDWNKAMFTERIAVSIRGTYTPVTPALLWLPTSIPLNVTALAGSEG